MEYKWPEGYVLIADFMDEPGHRYHIAFFEEKPGAHGDTKEFEMVTIDHTRDGEHSLSAIAICGNKVLAKDRKMVKDGTSEQVQ